MASPTVDVFIGQLLIHKHKLVSDITFAPGQFANSGTHVAITAQAATDIPLLLKGATSQSAHLFEVQDGASAVKLFVDSSGTKISTPSTELILEQTGDAGGTSALRLRNRGGAAGALFETNYPVVDFGFSETSGNKQGNLRFETRVGFVAPANTTYGEFQILINPLSTPSKVAFRAGEQSVIVGSESLNAYEADSLTRLGIYTASPAGMIHSKSRSSTDITFIAQGASSQSANLSEWRNSSSAVIAFVDKDGKGVFGTVSAAKSANYTATSSDSVLLCDATSASFTITLPAAASSSGKTFTIKKTDSSANTVTIDANASETIDGALTQIIAAQYNSVSILCDGSQWWIL